jgi:translation initiation factor 1
MDLVNPYDNLTDLKDQFTSAKAIKADLGKVHIRMQQRNGRKCITTIQGLPNDLDIAKITRALKKTFQCNGSITQDAELGEVIQLSGDQRTNVRKFFIEEEVCYEDQIVLHGG